MDFYGEMLTDRQREFLNYYYNDDLSLAEIAENSGISRQGVRDSIKRAEHEMTEMEEKLGFIRRLNNIYSGLDVIKKDAEIINRENLNSGLSPEINDLTVHIKSICDELSED
jgi:hypothetical protein